ncbi:MAG TPA: efflux RND transporter periplasmic adaptor subunit [Longimicrobiaceae bacterium]|jgi:multidrug resistance efflux pump|nr:efflux RND transporter periplasmic adaptor subunit [Longimicrobiaceae bacterium]
MRSLPDARARRHEKSGPPGVPVTGPGPAEKPKLVLRLPTIDEAGSPGAGFVHGAVGWTLGTLGAIVGAGLLVASLVSMNVTVKAPGSMEPVRVWPVRTTEPGTVDSVLVATGDTVRKGQPVLQLDSLQLETTLLQLQAQLRAAQIDQRRSASAAPVERRQQGDKAAQAQARLVTARATLRQRMVENDAGTNVDSLLAVYRPGRHVGIDLAVAEVQAAEAETRLSSSQNDILALERFDRAKKGTEEDQLAAQIRATRERLQRLTVLSPTHGVVLTEQIERLGGSYVREGELLLEVADLDEWRVNLYVPERDVHKIRLGDSVQVEVQAFNAEDEDRLRGSVVFVAPEPVGAGQSTSTGGPAPAVPTGMGMYRVVARLDQKQLARMGVEKFRRGYTVQGQIITRSGRIITLLWDYLHDQLRGRA